MINIDKLKTMNNTDMEYFKDTLKSDMISLIELLQLDLNRLNDDIDLNNIECIYKTALNMNMNYARLQMCKSYNDDLNKQITGE